MTNIKEKSLNKNIILNVAKALLSVIFPFISYPYISRILGPEQLGKIQFSQSIIAFALIIASIGVSAYGLREGSKIKKNKEQITEFASEIFTINLIFSVLSYVILFILIVFNSKIGSYKSTLLILSLQIAFTSIGLDWLLNVYEDFLYSTLRFAIMQLISLILMLTCIKQPSDVNKYAAIIVLANTGAYILNFIYTRKYVHLKIIFNKKIFRHLKSLLILFSNDVAQQIYINSDTIILGYMCGDVATGIYSTAVKIYTVVKKLLNAAIMASLPKLASIKEEEKYKELVTNLLLYSTLLIIPAMVMLICCSSEVINIVSGPEYIQGSMSLKIITLALIFAVYANIFCNGVLIIKGKEREVLAATLIASLINVLINVLLIKRFGIEAAAISTVIAEMSVCLYSLKYAYKHIEIKRCLKELPKILIGIIVIPVVYYVLKPLIKKDIVFIIVFGIISSCIYIVVELLLKNEQIKSAKRFIQEKIIK